VANKTHAWLVEEARKYVLRLQYDVLKSPLRPEEYLRLSAAASEEAFWALLEETIDGKKWLIVLDPLTFELLAIHPRVGTQVLYSERAKDVVSVSRGREPLGRVIDGHLYPYGSVAAFCLQQQDKIERERRGVGFVYFIQAGEGWPIKIGWSRDPAERLRTLQRAHGQVLTILALLPDAKVAKERELHKQFAAYRLEGEWFQPSVELLAYIREVLHGKSA
jgi:T5orf172 domain